MKIGDLVKPSWTMLHFNQIGVIIEGPTENIFLHGASLQTQYLVSWQDGTQEWYHMNNLEVLNENR